MIAHALDILRNELAANLATYPASNGGFSVALENIAQYNPATVDPNEPWDIVLSLVNLKEESSLKNVPHYVRNDVTAKVTYENPPVFVNQMLMFTVVRANYPLALTALSRIIRFFQSKRVFTQDNVAPASLAGTTILEEDQLEDFTLIMDLYSPSLEEVNHLWGTLGGKQYPFVLYSLRLTGLKYRTVLSESGMITEVVNDFYHKNPNETN
ncbi:MAG: DUF4255 domain-containing protein [Bacteroidetes bacterium]|nr:MAG: DUF4255 domain-containing protein [Bacteroidota bacterium]